jgi:transcriptional regulator
VFRRDLIPLLLDNAMSLSQIARAVGESPKDVTQALTHLSKSLKHTEYDFMVEPAECRRCGFEFGPDKLNRPSKCPKCKGTWIAEPFFLVKARPEKDSSRD